MLICIEKSFFSILKDFIELLKNINEGFFGVFANFIDNLFTILPILIFVFGLIYFVISFRNRTQKISTELIKRLENNRKYIKGVFVELNDTKELLRYFCNGKKWKKRIIEDYNALFNDENGKLFRNICSKSNINFKLAPCSKNKDIQNEINQALFLIKNFRERKYDYREPYYDTLIKLQLESRHYINPLEKLNKRLEFLNSRYIVLTGSAGNGKTNLLANFAEMLIDKKKICIFLNAKDINGNIRKYFENILNKNNYRYFKGFWKIQKLICKIFKRQIYIVIDAINENNGKDFTDSLPTFINDMLIQPHVKLIVSCRREYFDLKYKKMLVESIDSEVYCYDIMNETYSNVAKEKLFENYKVNYSFKGQVSEDVKNKLFKQLLLMRLFFEVYKESCLNINSLDKYKIFQCYLNNVLNENNDECKTFFDAIVQEMCNRGEFSYVKKSWMEELGYSCDAFDYILDESVLLSRKLTYHPNSILENYDEEIYFVFDEMRDYCVAKYILQSMCDDYGNPIEEKVILFMDSLIEKNSVCTEGVINYIYWFYKDQENKKVCEIILEKYVKPRDKSLSNFRMNRESGLRCWGTKLIFETEEDLKKYEWNYLDFIAEENPGDELSRIFDYLIKQEKMNKQKNLKVYLDMLFKIHNKNKFIDFLKNSVSVWNDEGVKVVDFIEIDKMLLNCNFEGCLRFRYFLYLFINFFEWDARDEVEEYLKDHSDFDSLSSFLKDKISFEEEEEDER